MKTIILNSLTLINFKGIQNLHIDFTNETFLYGANEAGKTSVSDAWHWLLTGKDSLDRKDFNIKNTVKTELNRSNHEVSASIMVDGEIITMKRVYKEIWTKSKGHLTATYTGNEQEYFYNDVPLKAGEFQAKISAFLDENILKMLTNPAFFNRLKWQDQRPVLTAMAGTISDVEVFNKITTADNKAAIANITQILNSGKTLLDYKKQISAAKKLKKEALEQIPNRIDEGTRSLPEIVDYAAIEAEIYTKQSAIADIDLLINDETAAFNLKNAENNQRQQKINALNIQLINAENEIRSNQLKAENDRKLKITQAENDVINVTANIKSKNTLIESTKLRIDILAAEKAVLLEKWHTENQRVLVYDDHKFSCPVCLRGFEAGDIEKAKAEMQTNFIADQTKNKATINAKGKALTEQIVEANKLIDAVNGQLDILNSDLVFNQTLLAEISEKVGPITAESKVFDSPNVMSLKAEIEALKAKSSEVTPVDFAAQKQAKADIQTEISALQTQLAGKSLRARIVARIQELRDQENLLSQEIADFEGLEFGIAAFDNAKILETERRVNELFGHEVTFKMFDKTIAGDLIDTCQCMYKGVPYADLNTAGKIWAGLIIIKALSKFYGVQAPVILDNRESTSVIPVTECQVINLVVSPKDTLLRVA